jgi:outer membrane protein insertion porin family
VDASSLAVGAYTTDTLGGGVKFGYPLSETDSIHFGLVAEHVKLGLNDTSPVSYRNFAATFGSGYTYGTGTVAWGRDTRDSAMLASSGGFNTASVELAGGSLQYYRGTVGMQRFYALSRSITMALTGELGYVRGISGRPVPFFKNFYAGGPGTVRGFKAFSLGPQDAAANVLGGTRKITGGAEILFPVPGAQSDKSLRLTAFVDAGQVFGVDQKVNLGDIRYSAGVGLAWNGPFGPLKISLAQPLNEKKGLDRVERLQLNFGAAF